MTHRNKKKAPTKYRFEQVHEVHEFFDKQIPESWEDAHYLMQVENKVCSKDLYLEALMEQQTRNNEKS